MEERLQHVASWSEFHMSYPCLSRSVSFFPVVFRVAVRVSCLIKYLSATFPNVGIEVALSFMKHDDAGTVAQMVVLRVAAGEATMGQKNTVVHQ